MLVIHSDRHRAHRGTHEIYRGRLVPCFETPERADRVLAAILRHGIGPIVEPDAAYDPALVGRVHAARYLRFLETAWPRWTAQGGEGDMLPAVWPIRGFRDDREPDNLVAQFGLYSFDGGTPLTAGTWDAARAGAEIALTAVRRIGAGARAAFGLTRPPGHHAGPDFCGGYCFLNNAAIAAEALRAAGRARVAVLDVDYHHGNGTQAIFSARGDVLTLSIHGDPRTEYPFYLGHADETGTGDGAGCNANYPLPAGSDNPRWFEALEAACSRVLAFRAEALVVPLGVDTYRGDPISTFQFDADEYRRLGTRLAALGLPTVFLLEGGYAVDEIGDNVAHVLAAFDAAAQTAS